MANPQLEDGYCKISNELLDAICTMNLSAYESKLFWFIVRRTYGFNKKNDRISYNQFQQNTGIRQQHIKRTLNKLHAKNMINQNSFKYSIQKDYDKWISLPKQVVKASPSKTLPKQVVKHNTTQIGSKPLPKQVVKTLPKQVDTKDKRQYIKTYASNLNLTPFLLLSLKFHKQQKKDGLFHQDFKKELTEKSKIVIEGAKTIEQLNRIDKEPMPDIQEVLNFILSDTGNGSWSGWKRNVVSLSSLRKKRDGEMKYFKIKNSMSNKHTKKYLTDAEVDNICKGDYSKKYNLFKRLEENKWIRTGLHA
ncbi:MAG: replication protein [Promethearchaeota archaeon]